MWDTSERPKAAVACDSCTAASPRLASFRLCLSTDIGVRDASRLFASWLSTDIGVRDASRSSRPDWRRFFSATDGRFDFYLVGTFRLATLPPPFASETDAAAAGAAHQ